MAEINLRSLSTLSKLEDWVSDPKNSSILIEGLKKKLDQGEMEALEEYLKDKKLKKSLCFNADDVDKIGNNEELVWFLDVMNGTKFPLRLLDLFFQKSTDSSQAFEGGEGPSASSSAPPATNKRKETQDRVLNWAKRQCNGGEKELSNVLEDISIKNVSEHNMYPFFVAEKVVVYSPERKKKKQTGLCFIQPNDESRILVITDEKRIPVKMMNLVHYQMSVCNVRTTILLRSEEPKEQQIKYNETLVPIKLCLRCITEAFLPALAVFRTMQRKELALHLKPDV